MAESRCDCQNPDGPPGVRHVSMECPVHNDLRVGCDEAAYQKWCDANRRPQTMPPDAEPVWIIRYADQDIPDEVFSSCRAEEFARRRFDQQRGNWSLSLFQEVARG